MHILDYLLKDADLYKDKTAFYDSAESCSYGTALADSLKTAEYIKTTENTSCAVGVFADHDVHTLIAFFGVVLSGNFYVPLDPRQPESKLEKIIQDAKLKLILGRQKEQEILPESYHGLFARIDQIRKTGKVGKSVFITAQMPPDAPLYMVYTSGSTGFPKGVLKSQGAMLDFIEAYADTFDFSHDEVIGSQTPFFFDASAKDIYLTLKLGAALQIIPEEKFLLPPALIRYLNEKKITFISWVPSALSLITQFQVFSEMIPETLRKVFFVGESFPEKHFIRWQSALPDIEYVNLYGASELAGICCYYRVPAGYTESGGIPIGKPLKNCHVFLGECTEDGKDVCVITEPRKTGEIFLSSKALALEYYHDPEKTARSFIQIAGERTFRTGDLAWYDEEGNLYFASRNDSQIKHMGQRIELGEIETVCQSVEQIEKACCLYDAEKKRIWLFCQLTEGADEDARSLLTILKRILVYYMLPQRIVIKDKLPLNANGKIDRQLLRQEI